mmetsp:Transcript_65197/g.155668  ORF Transcript_65197/g.155668 Transcript_65197/m.155668 type:complete len:360 (+) Transcript_65197:134-1213(+)|eukprot:CAMPEP_0178400702 /NCGR_PEP_ID=MMETSP0689_2-20121128/15925_1 /TAXON_ID=160604 /ORGANISM="Amphidinium massartii, Strain CS-259" /LENGTH=359 /DNA_ID=CAMNT_0020021505 /DNA_START=129 /DNA_END=1208 /DNA_ORIENTATION=+
MAAQTFDAAMTLANFLSNATETALELPPMTAAQRREVKELAAKYPTLRCESYGFGADRQLHLFKSQAKAGPPAIDRTVSPLSPLSPTEQPALRVRNTFIDGWIANEADAEEAEPVIFRSMPPQLCAQVEEDAQLCSEAALGKAPVAIEERRAPGATTVTFCERVGSPTHSTTASSGSRASSPSPGLSTANAETTATTEVVQSESSGSQGVVNNQLQVRNTFVHFEEPAPSDPRVVQSMPHGMFGKCLADELAEARSTDGGRVVPPPPQAPAPGAMPFSQPVVQPLCEIQQVPAYLQALIGMEVQVTGLVKAPAFNGQRGLVYSWDVDVSRYNVLLSLPGGPQWAKIRWENLLLLGAAAR